MVQWGLDGGTSLALAYGQTGSGKTYTISGLEEAITKVLLERKSDVYDISLRIIELFGDNIYGQCTTALKTWPS
jgi:kinesin family member 2/24